MGHPIGHHLGHIGSVDKVEAGIHPQKADQIQPAENVLEAGSDVGVGVVGAAAKEQGGIKGEQALRPEAAFLPPQQHLVLAADVVGAGPSGNGQRLQVLVQKAGRGKVDHLLTALRIQQLKELQGVGNIHGPSQGGIPPSCRHVDQPVHLP
jgi:hypothetical protein